MKLPPEKFAQKKQGEGGKDLPTEQKKLQLNSAEELYAEIRDKNFNAVGAALSKKAKIISAAFEVCAAFVSLLAETNQELLILSKFGKKISLPLITFSMILVNSLFIWSTTQYKTIILWNITIQTSFFNFEYNYSFDQSYIFSIIKAFQCHLILQKSF